VIPAASGLWRPADRLPLAGMHPASRLGMAVLAIVTALAAPAPALLVLAPMLAWLLWRAGLRGGGLVRWMRPWWPLALVVLAVHTLTATDIAPLGQPTVAGAARGMTALGRVAVMLQAMALAGRVLPLGDLVAALGWWLRPFRPLGLDNRLLGVTLAVAAGTAPRAQAEAARMAHCLRLRTSDGRRPGPWRRLTNHWRVLPPLMENLARRSETVPLAVAGRLPADAPGCGAPTWAQGALLAGWTALLVVVVL
jgi:energy-coupling factor transporter transmembrane protein EcfT